MGIFYRAPARPPLGLDLGASFIKVVQLMRGRDGLYLERYGVRPTTPGTILQGQVERPADLSQEIRILLNQARIRHRVVNLALGGQHVILRHITLPPLSEKELPEAVRWEAEKYIMIPMEEAVVDFRYLGKKEGEHGPVMEVALVAAPQEIVTGYLEAVVKAGLHPAAVEITPFALERAFQAATGKGNLQTPNNKKITASGGKEPTANQPAEEILLLDLGHETTELLVLEGAEYRFARSLDIGMAQFLSAVKERMSADDLTARRHLMDPHTWTDPEINSIAIELLHNVQRSLEYYLDKVSQWENVINKMYVTGGGRAYRHLVNFLAHNLFVEPRFFDPLSQLTAGKERPNEFNSSLLGTAAGLALRSRRNDEEKH